MKEKAVCPRCGGEYNKGASVCYTCKRYVSLSAWFKMNWLAIPIAGALLAAAYLIACPINGAFI